MAATKLLFYTHGLVDGGAERLWSCLASELHRRGYSVVFVQDFEAQDNRNNLDPAITVHTIGRGPAASIRALADVIIREKPDIAFSAVGGSNLKLILARTLARSPVKCVISFHGYEEWKSGILSFLTYLGLPFWSVLSDRTVAVSHGLAAKLKAVWGADAKRTVAIHNPVFYPADARPPSEQDLARREDVVLAVGRLAAVKDFPNLIRAFARLNRPGARLVILGKGPEHAALARLISELGIDDRVELAGYASAPWPYYETAKCLVVASRSEQFGNVIVEAMAYGLPVVSTGCDGPSEILAHGKFGRLVAIGDPDALAHAIGEALSYPGDPAVRAERAAEFSFAARVPYYEALIRDVLGLDATKKEAAIAGTSVPLVSLEQEQRRI